MTSPLLNVLLVEDDEMGVTLFRLVVKKGEFNIRLQVVEGGRSAIDYLSGSGPYFDRATYPIPDLVVLDLFMPGVSGFDVLEWRQNCAEIRPIPFVVFSGSAMETDKKNAHSLGATGFVPKPADLEKLRLAIAEILRIGKAHRRQS